MKKIITSLLILISTFAASAQEKTKRVYFTEPLECILQIAQTSFSDNNPARDGVRATCFTNFPYYMHLDFGKTFGIVPGIAIKNIGIKTKDEEITQNSETTQYKKIKRRVFAAGASLAIKCGSLKKEMWAYGGGGIDWAFHYRQKLYKNGSSRDVSKSGEWTSNATPTFIPSVFFGIQTPYSINIKGTYYFKDFLNPNYNGSLGNFSNITQSQLFTLTISLVFNTGNDSKSSNTTEVDNQSPKNKIFEL